MIRIGSLHVVRGKRIPYCAAVYPVLTLAFGGRDLYNRIETQIYLRQSFNFNPPTRTAHASALTLLQEGQPSGHDLL